jgi:hypothetical protein
MTAGIEPTHRTAITPRQGATQTALAADDTLGTTNVYERPSKK